jgi:hypothetical protein
MVAEMFRDRDWNAEDAPNIAMFVEEARANWNATPPGAAPHDIIEAVPFSKNFGKSMNIEAFNDNRARAILEQWCLEGLLWGLANPSEFAAWYAMHMKRYAETSTFARQSGLAIDAAPQELSHLVQDGERILRDYEREVQQLPQIPPRLLSDAQAIGRALV